MNRRSHHHHPLRRALALALAATVLASPAAAQSRGELLYTTHCIACHDTQVHWRDGKAATDWGSLMIQVQRWQDQARLGWTADDVVQVTRYLNQRYYRFAPPVRPAGRRGGQWLAVGSAAAPG